MASSTMSYRRSTKLESSSSDPELETKLQQARQQRTSFYRRLAEAGSRVQQGAGGAAEADDDDVIMDTSTRRWRQRLDSSSPHGDRVSPSYASPVDQLPEPRSSWRYYTSYDNGEWRRHATPMYKADAELDVGISGKMSERRTASLSGGLTTSREVDIDEEGDEKPLSALARHQRLRGSACLTQNLAGAHSADVFNTTDTGPTTLEEVKLVMKDVFDRSRYGAGSDVSELVQKILKERLSEREPTAAQTAERVIYANADRQTILDDASQPLPHVIPEIPEGSDESEFAERVLAPSGRRWTSSPSPDSQRVFVVKGLYGDDCFDSGIQYEDIGRAADVVVDAAGGRGTSLENWRDSSCRSPSNVAETVNEEVVKTGGFEARWDGALPTARRTVVASEMTHQSEKHTSSSSPVAVTSTSRKDTFGRRIPADAVEIKVELQRKPSDESYAEHGRSRYRDEADASFGDKTSPTRSPGYVGESGNTAEKQEFVREETDLSDVRNVSLVARTSSAADDRNRKKSGQSTDDGRIWIPVMHVAGSSGSKTDARSDMHLLARHHPVQADRRGTDAITSSTASDRGSGRAAGFSSSQPIVVSTYHQDISASRDSRISPKYEEVTEEVRTGMVLPASPSLRVGSGVGSFGYRSSIVVDRSGPPSHDARSAVSRTTTSYTSDVTPTMKTVKDCDWIVEKAL